MSDFLIDKSFSGLMRSRGRQLEEVQRRNRARGQIPARLNGDAVALVGEDLDDVVESGWRVQPLNANASAALHYPVNRAGILEVVGSTEGSGHVLQRYTDYQFTNTDSGRFTWVRYRYNGVWTAWRRQGGVGPSRGPGFIRVATPSAYWEQWQDTDGTQKLYVGDKSGGWRQFSGYGSQPDRAWDTTQGTTGNALVAGRTDELTIPTVLLPNEDINVWLTYGGSGFTSGSVNLITRNPTNTVVRFRFMQIGSFLTQSYAYSWQIVQV
jgi:hypothetical protein